MTKQNTNKICVLNSRYVTMCKWCLYLEVSIPASATHIGSVPLQVLSFWQVLTELPVSVNPSSHENWQVSPGLATSSDLNWQEIIPLTGAKILGHIAIEK